MQAFFPNKTEGFLAQKDNQDFCIRILHVIPNKDQQVV